MQSAWTRKPLDATHWKRDMKPAAWLGGLSVFVGLIVIALSVLGTSHNSLGAKAITALFLGLLFVLQLLTLDFVFNRPGKLWKLHSAAVQT